VFPCLAHRTRRVFARARRRGSGASPEHSMVTWNRSSGRRATTSFTVRAWALVLPAFASDGVKMVMGRTWERVIADLDHSLNAFRSAWRSDNGSIQRAAGERAQHAADYRLNLWRSLYALATRYLIISRRWRNNDLVSVT